MGREVRLVHSDWKHPTKVNGHYIPLSQLEMPQSPYSNALYQMYETRSKGTPVSPAMKSPQELARWLVENNVPITDNHSSNKSQEKNSGSYEAWLLIAQGRARTLSPKTPSTAVRKNNGFNTATNNLKESTDEFDRIDQQTIANKGKHKGLSR